MSDLINNAVEIERGIRKLYRQVGGRAVDEKFQEPVEMLSGMKNENIDHLSSMKLHDPRIEWSGPPAWVIKKRLLDQVEKGLDQISSIRALEFALQCEEEILKLYEDIHRKATKDGRSSLGPLIDNQRVVVEELRIMIVERFTPVVYKFKRRS